ncbi:hypothetical protein [Kitasatospora sp. NBC_01266]|uniref:hypothetical protein n=1 Tax=Kitasatospora sp. NBC_01266 TaxID=2903572 RepID=UPI002E37889A|nr:hypothetical protein [Kitasatospora sp. NBC_01266]
MANESPDDIPIDPVSGVNLQQLTAAAAAQPAGIAPQEAGSVQGSVREERSGAITAVVAPTAATQPSTGPAYRRQPAGSGD